MKKLLSILTCSSLLLSPVTAFAQETAQMAVEEAIVEKAPSMESANEPTSEKLESIIKKVRPLIEVPEEYTDFIWDYYNGSYRTQPSWNLGWTDGETGDIYITCDNEGRITSYGRYIYDRDYGAHLPDISPDELIDTALGFVKKTAPYIKDSDFELTNNVTASLYGDTYRYQFMRYENGIPVPDNMVSVTVNYKTCQVESFSCSYNADVSFDGKKPVISEDEAKKILGENQKIVLSYKLKTEYDEETGERKSRNAYLVYTPEKSYVSVDAYTGKVYNERSTWSVNEFGVSGGSGGAANDKLMSDSVTEESAEADRDAGYQLTEEELEQLGVLDSLITKDEAIAVITQNDKLYIDEKATAISASLNKDYNNDILPIMIKNEDGTEKEEEQYVWNLTFTAPSDGDGKYNYSRMYAVVDANDGSIISFSASTPDHWYYTENKLSVPELKFTAEQAEKISLDFIKEVQPEKAESIRLSDSWEHTAIKYLEAEDGNSVPVYGNKALRYTRVNEGVDFTYNSFSTAVDLVTGKITQFSYRWFEDVVFESPKNVITPDKALMSLYSYDGFGLNYEINSDYTYNKYLAEKNEKEYIDYDELYDTHTYTRAVYSAYNPGTTTIRAMDGVMIDYSGNEYKERTAYTYDDIEGHWAQSTIERFTYLGIGFEGGKFLPDSYITSEELINIFSSSRLYSRNDSFTLEEGSVTRVDAVKYIISALGYYKIACLENVFITDFADNTDLKAEDVGFIAIARGFGLVQGDGNTFRPYDKLTRAEAFTLIENVITLGMLDN